MAWTRLTVVLVAAGAVAAVALSGGESADPRTPAGLPGLPPPFLGTAVVGDGGIVVAVDAYGDIVDLRAPGPAGRALIDNPADRQAAGSVAADTGIVPTVAIAGGLPKPLWQADSVTQRYLPETNAARTVARFGQVRMVAVDAASSGELARIVRVGGPPGETAVPAFRIDTEPGLSCRQRRGPSRVELVCSTQGRPRRDAERLVADAIEADRRWISRARPLGSTAPPWASRGYRRALLTLRALTDRHTGAVAAGARGDWAYVWPRDAGAAALAFAAAGYRGEARRVARFLLGLDLTAAARFHDDGTPVAGREAQGDAAGWAAVAARAADLPPPSRTLPWRGRPDYWEGAPGAHLANALAANSEAAAVGRAFGTPRGLVREAGKPESGLDSAAAWAVRPFPQPALFPAVRRTLLHLAREQSRFGIVPGEGWPGVDPWTAPTAWSAWSLAALGERPQALRLLGALRRAATPAGALPERVDARTGVPTSTTPLTWSHAFAILTLRELWP